MDQYRTHLKQNIEKVFKEVFAITDKNSDEYKKLQKVFEEFKKRI